MKVKNVSGGPRAVPLLDNRVVQDGEVVEVPEFQPGHTDENPLPIVWPGTTWQPVPDKAPGKTVKVTSDPAAAKE
jgi:hypothetical protein